MSVIAGVVSFGDVQPRPNVSKSILSQIDAPGEDRPQHYNDRYIDLAAQHRASKEAIYSGEQYVVVVDCPARVINHLCERVSIPHQQRDNAGRVVSIAYEKCGEAIVHEIQGEFVFAIWDKKKRALFCARDRFGRAPLTYATTPNGIVFASDFLPIANCLPTRPKINEAWILQYIKGAVADEVGTPFLGINRLPPASILKWSGGQLETRKYWTFDEVGPTSEGLQASEILEALESSVEECVADSNSFTMLSGGLDSSSVAVLTRDQFLKSEKPPLNTVSLTTETVSDLTERPFIEAVLAQGGFKPHFVDVALYDPFSEVERLLKVQGAPSLARGAPVFDQAIARAQELGFSTALDGHGGDEIISSFGEMRLYELANEGKWGTLLSELRRTSKHSNLQVLSNYLGMHGSRGRGFTARFARKMHSLLSAPKPVQPERTLLHDDFHLDPAIKQSRVILNGSNPSRFRSERDYHQHILSAPLQSQALEFIHRQFRSRGLRLELPFWDMNVVDLCLRVPSHQKLKNGVPRSLIRSVMADRLPEEVSKRTSKFDFSDLFLNSIISGEDRLRAIAAEANHKVFDFIDRDEFAGLIDDLSDPRRDVQLPASSSVWTVLNLYLWFEMISSVQLQHKEPIEIPC